LYKSRREKIPITTEWQDYRKMSGLQMLLKDKFSHTYLHKKRSVKAKKVNNKDE
jgi:hypothetical protein